MSEFSDTLDHFYSLDLLASLDPTDNRAMAEILLGVYIVNARADAQVETMTQHLRPSVRSLYETCKKIQNLDRVAKLIGDRAINVVDISGGAEPIRYRGFNAVDRARGVIGTDLYRRPMMNPSRSNDKLRLVQPRRLLRHSDDEYTIQVADPANDFSPLVDIQIANSLRSFK